MILLLKIKDKGIKLRSKVVYLIYFKSVYITINFASLRQPEPEKN